MVTASAVDEVIASAVSAAINRILDALIKQDADYQIRQTESDDESDSPLPRSVQVEPGDDDTKIAKLNLLLTKAMAYSQFITGDWPKELSGVVKDDDEPKKPGGGSTLAQPPGLTGIMKSYQLEGFSWLVGLFENGLNGILADETGLGKTIQTIAFFAHMRAKGASGPLMVVAPEITHHKWTKHFETWFPAQPIMVYGGSEFHQ